MTIRNAFGALLALFVLAGIGVWAYKNFARTGPAAPAVSPPDASTKAVVYYFRTNFRCPTCMKFESYTKEAVEKYFPDQVRRGEVRFVMLNIEEKPNEHFIEDYQLKTKSVVLASPAMKDRWKNLDQIWKRVADREGYMQYIREELMGFLAGMN